MEGPGRAGGLDELLHLRPEPIARILMHLVAVSAGQENPVAEHQAADQGRQAAEATHCNLPGNDGRESRPGVAGGKCLIGHSQNRNEPGMEREPVNVAIGGAQHQPSVDGCCGVIRVILHIDCEIEHRPIVDFIPDRPQRGRSPGHGGRRRRSEATTDRDPVVDDQRQWTILTNRPTGRLKHAVEVTGRVFRSDMTDTPELVRRGIHGAAKLQSQGEHVEARTEIRR